MEKYYRILGLSLGASKEEAKRAYRRLALKYHPDKNPSQEAQEMFLKIKHAYEQIQNPTPTRPQSTVRQGSQRNRRRPEDTERARKERERMRKEALRRSRLRQQRIDEENRKTFIKILLYGAVLLVLGAAVYYGNRLYVNILIDNNRGVTIAEVKTVLPRSIEYTYQVNGHIYEDWCITKKSWSEPVSGNGMPLQTGDRFELHYRKDKPQIHRINYYKLASSTLNRYLLIAQYAVLDIYKEELDSTNSNKTPEQIAKCVALLTYEAYGADGLAKLYFHREPWIENTRNNSITSKSMRKEKAFQTILKHCGILEAD